MQQITLTLDHGNFFCPVTGQNILSSENCEASPATTFIYLDEIGDFAHTSDDLAEVQESLDDDSDESELDQFLAAIKDTKNLVVFSITVNNGPFSNAVHVGIDMNFCEEEEAQARNQASCLIHGDYFRNYLRMGYGIFNAPDHWTNHGFDLGS